MSLLDDAIQKQQNLVNKGYSVEVIQTAAAMVIAEKLDSIAQSLQMLERDLERGVSNGLNRGTD